MILIEGFINKFSSVLNNIKEFVSNTTALINNFFQYIPNEIAILCIAAFGIIGIIIFLKIIL